MSLMVPSGEQQGELMYVDWSQLQVSAFNPRRHFEAEALRDLREDIKRNGLLEPLIVREAKPQPDVPAEKLKLEVVAGERRYRALSEINKFRNGTQKIPVMLMPSLSGDDRQSFRVAVTENLEREALSPYEETLAILQLLRFELRPSSTTPASHESLLALADFLKKWVKRVPSSRPMLLAEVKLTLTVDEVDQAISRTFRMREGLKVESFVNNRLPLLTMPEDLQDALRRGRFPYNAAKQVAKVQDDAKRASLIEAAANGASYRTLNIMAKEAAAPAKDEAPTDAGKKLQEDAKAISNLLQKLPILSHNQREKLNAAFTRIREVLE